MSRFARTDDQRATTSLELFYDLVFVFAVTQISHHLLGALTWEGAGQSALLLLVVWWSWNYTAWVTNELDPESPVVRLLMIALMLASLMMAVAIPHAFGSDAGLFVGAYLTIQIGRHAFLAFVAAEPGGIERERAASILAWFVAAGVFWIAGAFAHGSTRTILWLVALVVDYAPPLFTYRLPGRGRLEGAAWTVETTHFSERFGLFIIIALGESVVVTGATTSEIGLDGKTAVAFGTAFLTTAALWWLYFTAVARLAEAQLHARTGTHRTSVARDAYTYLHVVLVGAIVLSAVGDELVIAHPTRALEGSAEVAAVVGGPALYLLGHTLFRWRLTGAPGWRRPLGAAACVLIGLLGHDADALVLALLVLVTLIAVIVGDYAAHARRAPAAQAA
jgi:low temperature requirement protein LtrA